MAVTKLIRVSITVSDLAQAAAFYRGALGLEVGDQLAYGDPGWNRLLGLAEGTTAQAVDVSVGEQTLKLIAFDPPGRSYPPARASNDPWFEHVALVTGDMESTWARLEKFSPETVTEGPPVVLPPNTGSVTAFKFRDPEGHPLELISFPDGIGDPRWQMGGAGIRGYDHTAIAVADLDKSLAFYEGSLGLEKAGQSLNRGPEQDHLDGLKGCEVDVVALAPPGEHTPHLELLHYRQPPAVHGKHMVQATDVASARQVYGVDDLESLVATLNGAKADFVSPGIVSLKSGGRAAAIRDPDGHMVVLKS
ncbi:Glyoxalase-like domain protein [Methyloligella halotolerans]|uniref:Glyoxalase-like domain protein n=1 Tax=Methyloligella halotolerans TaxID=1177755 RepID=A0A1E2RYU4_9HYPH|nr:VOC family protein [Methyloligella halotolerans]ODA67403.1 Glyoxalase-like domain protein [Methyloligella halotolerans]